MAEINDILKNFPEEIIQNKLYGKLVSGEIKWEHLPILLKKEKIESNQILFSHNETSLRISFLNKNSFDNSLDKSLFWAIKKNENIEVSYLPCGTKQIFSESLEIGFGDEIISDNKTYAIEKISENLSKDFVFKSDKSDFIFVQTYPNKTEQSFTIHGMKKRADIIVQNNKWILKKIVNKSFTKKYEDFLTLNIAEHPLISFVEASKAKEAYETIKAEETEGNTLISLWETYSKIELERAEELKEQIGIIDFTRKRFISGGITEIQIDNSKIKEQKDELSNISLEIHDEKKEKDKKSNYRYPIKSISNRSKNSILELYDELGTIPEKGKLTISLIGDEIVKKRREKALKGIREDRRFVSRNLLFAIENHVDAMFDNKRQKEKALTDRTRKFLKEKFGIDDLTSNQRDAVEIAINTPDIAIIQGPPGTGKTTVVAAICDRLIEIAEKNKKNNTAKQILVSAFQNDTVEHIASKIYTHGLPTIKIGKETQSNIRAEDKFIDDMKSSIDNSLQKLTSNSSVYRISQKLKDIRSVYLSEKNEENLKLSIDSLLKDNDYTISDELWNDWQEINKDQKLNKTSREKNIVLLKGIRTETEAYNDDGYYKIKKLLKSDLQFTKDERAFLENCHSCDPDESTLKRLTKIKETYLEKINSTINSIVPGNNNSILEWLNNAIKYFKQEEENSYENEETFIIANLELLRDDLEGSAEYIRETIKNYCESLAATNQVAGGKDVSDFSCFDNVILEEAARSNPLDLLIPMTKAVERIIMVGDQNQLPHLLENDIAEETSKIFRDDFNVADTRKKLEESLFGIIFKNLESATPQRTITLTEQFRMHPFIGDFISRIYYDDKLKNGLQNQIELKKHGLELPWAKDKVAIFCNIPKKLGEEESGKSKSRSVEAKRIIALLDELKGDSNFENLSIGIITFYAKQVNEILKEAEKKGYAELRENGCYEISPKYKETRDKREKLRIGSVDSFQGKEFDIVILSTVRSNKIDRNQDNYKKIFGFLTLENRLNVAFSRAQKLLIVTGDGDMFADEYAKTHVEGLYEFYTNLSIDKTYGNRIQ